MASSSSTVDPGSSPPSTPPRNPPTQTQGNRTQGNHTIAVFHGHVARNIQTVSKIEDIIESLVDALQLNRPLAIPLRSRRTGLVRLIRFPATTAADVKKFSRFSISISRCIKRIACLFFYFPTGSLSSPHSPVGSWHSAFWECHHQEVWPDLENCVNHISSYLTRTGTFITKILNFSGARTT
jgi:hypothetical protein